MQHTEIKVHNTARCWRAFHHVCKEVEYCNFLVFVQSHISGCIYPNFNKFSLDIASGCDMIILWLCNILGISGFVLYLPQPGKSKTSRMSTQSDSLGASKDFTL